MRNVRSVPGPPSTTTRLTTPVSASTSSSLEILRGDSSSKVAYSDLFADGVPVLGSDRSYILGSKRSQLPSLYSATDALESECNAARAIAAQLPGASFNCKTYGSLRADKEPIRLFSLQYLGLLLTACAAGFTITFLRYGFRPLLVAYLSLHHKNQFKSAQYLLEWPGALAVFIGLLSDCLPICGYRRRPYMVLGWVTSFVMFTSIVVVTLLASAKILLFVDPTKRGDAIATSDLERYPEQFAVMYVAFAVIGSVGLQVAWVTSLAMTIELAQREPLYARGHFQSLYLIVYYTAALFAQVLVSKVLYPGDEGEDLRSEITMGEAGVVLSIASALTFPAVLFFLKDERVRSTAVVVDNDQSTCASTLSFGARMNELLRFCQQQVVYRVILFVCGVVLILGMYNQNLREALAIWSNITPAKALDVQVAQNTCIVLGLVLWKACLVNTSWQKLVVAGVCFYVGCCVVLTVPTVYAWLRHEWFYLVFTALLEVPKGWLKLYSVVPATEIAEIGCEGVTMGLLFSFQALIYIAANTLSLTLSQVIGTNVTEKQVLADSSQTRNTVFTAATVYYVINLSSIVLAPILPAQKIAAQQMRAYGGYNTAMGYVVVIGFVLLLLFGLTANLVMIGTAG